MKHINSTEFLCFSTQIKKIDSTVILWREYSLRGGDQGGRKPVGRNHPHLLGLPWDPVYICIMGNTRKGWQGSHQGSLRFLISQVVEEPGGSPLGFSQSKSGGDVWFILCIEDWYSTTWPYIVLLHGLRLELYNDENGDKIYTWVSKTVVGQHPIYIWVEAAWLDTPE